MATYADAPARRRGARPAFTVIAGELAARFGRWREYRRTLSELEALDARTPRDIGLTRGDLRRVAREAAGL
jgi:uncharacterized protein YjiS (DUF1127 family)